METITIKEIEGKPSGLVIVKYLDSAARTLEATMNTKWQAQEVDYLEKDVGIGGSVSVLIQQKEKNGNKYVNITSVDLTSAKRGYVEPQNAAEGSDPTFRLNLDKLDKPFNGMSQKDISIVSQVLVKCATKILASSKPTMEGDTDIVSIGFKLNALVVQLKGAYNASVLDFEQNG